MLFSIIIPVYNVENYLDRCIQSVLNQNFNDYEVLLINDGSTDRSLEKCESYNYDKRIKIISKANGGASSARNCGLKRSKGEYIIFLDSDDYLVGGSLEELSHVIKEYYSDVFSIEKKIVNIDNTYQNTIHKVEERNFILDEYLKHISKNNDFNACACYYVYKKAFLDKHGFLFCEGIVHEDELWTPMVVLSAETICTSKVFMYCHCIRYGSVMHSDNFEKRAESLEVVLDELLKIPGFQNNPYAKALRNQWALLYLQTIIFNNALCTKYPRTMVIKYAQTFKMKLKAFLHYISPKAYITVHNIIKPY